MNVRTLLTKEQTAEVNLYEAEQAFIAAVEKYEQAQLEMAAANERLEEALAAFPEDA